MIEKRKRGRPRKYPPKESNAPKRGRGRPRKYFKREEPREGDGKKDQTGGINTHDKTEVPRIKTDLENVAAEALTQIKNNK